MFSICILNIGLKLKLLIANMIGDRADVEPMLLFKIYKKVITTTSSTFDRCK